MKTAYQVIILLSSMATTAVVTHHVTKKSDEEKFLQFKKNMEELQKENQKLRERCIEANDEIDDLESEVNKEKDKCSKEIIKNFNLIDFIDQYQTATENIFKDMAKPVSKIVNQAYLDVIDDILHAKDQKELSKLTRKLERIDFTINDGNDSERMMNTIFDSDDELDDESDDDEDDDEDESEIINRMNLNDIITPKQYQELCERIYKLTDEDDVDSYKTILDDILEYIFIKRQIAKNSTHRNELNDLNFISSLSISKEDLENIENFYDIMKFCIININEVYNEFQRYMTLRDNKFLNDVKFFNNIVLDLIPKIICRVDNIKINDDRVYTIAAVSNILRQLKSISDTDGDKKKFDELLEDIVVLNNRMLSKDRMREYMNNEYSALEEYYESVEEYLENIENVITEGDVEEE